MSIDYLTTEEKEFVASVADSYPPGFGYAFAGTRLKGKLVEDESTICRLITRNIGWAKKASPEVALALRRQNLSPQGIRFALSNLMRYFGDMGLNYLDVLEVDPEMISLFLTEKK